MKILYVTTIGTTMGFFISFITELINDGHTVEIATNCNVSKIPIVYKKLGAEFITLQRAVIRLIREISRLIGV